MGILHFLLNLMPSPFVWFFARPYVAGDSLQKALNKVESLWQEKETMSTVDLLGEDVNTEDEVQIMVNIYMNLLEGLKEKSKYCSVSLKPTALGINISKSLCLENLKKILSKASEYNILVTMDMEDSPLTDITLELYKILKPDYPILGTVLQTRLFRTGKDIIELPSMSHIRLCIGIYKESKDIALQNKRKMKDNLLEYTKKLHQNNHFVGFATHDEPVLRKTFDYIKEKKITNEQIEFQFLLGVPREKIQQEIQANGFNVRMYVPFATKKKYATKYAIRRFDENPHMAIYILRNLWAKWWVKVLVLGDILIAAYFVLIYLGIA